MSALAAPIRILLVDSHSLFRDALCAVLDSQDDLQVVGEVGHGDDAIAEAERSLPDVALIDCDLPGMSGISVVAALKESVPECRSVILCGEDDGKVLVAAVEAGAAAFLKKESPLVDLIDATRSVYEGGTVIPHDLLGPLLNLLVNRGRKRDEASARIAMLTRREREVLACLSEGADNPTIAKTLFISPETARTHIQNILSKLKVHSRLEAAAFVIQNNIQDLLLSHQVDVAVGGSK